MGIGNIINTSAYGLDTGTLADVQVHQADWSQHRLASASVAATMQHATADG